MRLCPRLALQSRSAQRTAFSSGSDKATKPKSPEAAQRGSLASSLRLPMYAVMPCARARLRTLLPQLGENRGTDGVEDFKDAKLQDISVPGPCRPGHHCKACKAALLGGEAIEQPVAAPGFAPRRILSTMSAEPPKQVHDVPLRGKAYD